jgi:acyl-[acyl-carrier-protein]-phospholipid O-acyltransferase/long-chain-fatty-acid--[acyl-carrier-protein] ligase
VLRAKAPVDFTNMAIALDRRISANLNYTVSSDVMNACIQQAGIKHVVTSRKFMDKMNFQLDAEIIYLEDFKEKVTAADKAIGYLQSYFVPAAVLESTLGLAQVKIDDVLRLSSPAVRPACQRSAADVREYWQRGGDHGWHLRPSDVLVGILPFFHSFSYTISLGRRALNIGGRIL